MHSTPSERIATEHEAGLDPEVRAFVESSRGVLFPPLAELPSGRLRATVNASLLSHDRIGYVVEPVARVERTSMADVPTRVYFPPAAPDAVIVYFHGGGFVAGGLDTHDKITRRLANGANSIVIAVDYALAPENPAPKPLDDAIAVTREAARRYPYLPLLVMGDSAGGAIAATVAQQARETRFADVGGQVLVYPVTEFDFGSRSMAELGTDYLLTREDLVRYHHDYIGRSEQPNGALPGRLDVLRGLPPAVVAVSGFDPLHDEGVRYARRLSEHGVDVLLVEHDDLIHGWLEIVDIVPRAATARDRLIEDVSGLIRRVTTRETTNSKEQ